VAASTTTLVSAAPPVDTAEPTGKRNMVVVSIMLSTIMTALDSTIANVALPHMAGSVSASADQITWVLTSYIIATAIMMPMTGWLAARLGRKRLFIISIVGFTLASALCGAAQSLGQIVVFRLIQGMLGASIMPLSQAVILDEYPVEQRGPAMALWGMGAMVAPVLGPVLGGWLTDNFSWRWVFYINLPIGVLSVLGVMAFINDDKHAKKLPFDIMGFALLSIMLAAFQLFLDRGQNNDWFHSTETVIEAWVAIAALGMFVVHTATAKNSFLPVALLKDPNFVMSLGLGAGVGLLVFSVLALLPPMLETLFGYPVVATGIAMAPRGVGTFVSMFFVGRLIGRVDTRLMIVTGLLLFATAFYGMSHFALGMSATMIAVTGFVQGLGTGLVFLPLSTLAFATLAPSLRADGAAIFSLTRSLGNSAGISIMQTLFTSNSQIVHAQLVEKLTPDNPILRMPGVPFDLAAPGGLAALEGEVGRQAAMVAYIDVFHLMFITTLVVAPLVFLLRKPNDQIPEEAKAVHVD
jgi:DHA2 family multidrug resistance protein